MASGPVVWAVGERTQITDVSASSTVTPSSSMAVNCHGTTGAAVGMRRSMNRAQVEQKAQSPSKRKAGSSGTVRSMAPVWRARRRTPPANPSGPSGGCGQTGAVTPTAAPATRVRPAEPGDVPAIVALVQALADYEREPDAAEGTAADFHAALFAPEPRVHALVAEVQAGADPDDPDGWVVGGIAVWYVTFSTWKARHGIWLEDLFVLPEHRRHGLGRSLLTALAGICAREGWPRFEWWVLDWNEPAHRFYESLGAVRQDDWTTWRVDGAALEELAEG